MFLAAKPSGQLLLCEIAFASAAFSERIDQREELV
jgi:hypothetical protein